MKEDVKALWTAALRSGEYEQGEGYLARDGKFCCLGVLCDLAAKAGAEVKVDQREAITAYDSSRVFPPQSVATWAGLASLDGSYRSGQEDWSNLANLNDTGVSFREIADIIEENF